MTSRDVNRKWAEVHGTYLEEVGVAESRADGEDVLAFGMFRKRLCDARFDHCNVRIKQ